MILPLSTSGSLSVSQLKQEFFPERVLVDENTWWTKMTLRQNSTFAPTFNPGYTNPNIQLQLTSSAVGNTNNGIHMTERIQDYDSFTLSFEIYNSNSGADSLCVFIGASNATVGENTGYSGYVLSFDAYGPSGGSQGINLLNGNNTYVVSNATSTWRNGNAWFPVSIVYNKRATNTWEVIYNGSSLFTYSDPNFQRWVYRSSNIWGFSAATGGVAADFWIRKVRLTSSNIPMYTLLDPINWTTKFTRVNYSGGLVEGNNDASGYTNGYGKSFWYLCVGGGIRYATRWNITNRLQDNESVYFSFRYANVVGNGTMGIVFGGTSTNNGNAYLNGWAVDIWSYTTSGSRIRGVNLFNSSSTVVASSATTDWINANSSRLFEIIYTRSTNATWVVKYNGTTIITYSDPNVESWVSSTSGPYFTIYADGTSMNHILYDLNLSYKPKELRISQLYGVTSGPPSVTSGSLSLSQFYRTENTNISNTTTIALDLGAYNMSPWNFTTSNIPDTGARWLWSVATAQTTPNSINFSITYTNTTNTAIDANLLYTCDNYVYVFHNKVCIGWLHDDWTNVRTVRVSLQPGKNLFEFIANNFESGGFAGLIFSCRSLDGNTVYFRSDNSSPTANPLTNSTKTFYAYEKSDRIVPLNSGMLDKLSPDAKASCRGAYSMQRLNTSYTGAVCNIRNGTNGTNSDFYADFAGNLNTAADGSGQTYSTWIAGATGYVQTWYDQSGTGNHATTATTAQQPVYNYNGTYQLTEFTSSHFFTVPNGTIPTGNSAFTFVAKHGACGNGFIIIGNDYVTSRTNNGLLVGTSSYQIVSANNDYGFGTNANDRNVVAVRYDGTTRAGLVNNVQISSGGASYNVSSNTTTIGRNATYGTLTNGAIYYLLVFNTSLSDNNIRLCTRR